MEEGYTWELSRGKGQMWKLRGSLKDFREWRRGLGLLAWGLEMFKIVTHNFIAHI